MSVIQYHGNPNLKPFGVQIEYTPYQIQEYIKCKEDPLYFIENYCKIISLDDGLVPFKLYPYQREFIKALHENRKIICMLSRQMGKTICVAAYIAWYVQFNPTKNVAVLANKGAAAREILSRIQLIIENIPLWLQQGVVSWNKGSVELENGSKVFTGSTSSSGIRGQSCVTDDTRVCVEENDNIFYVEINKLLNNRKFIEIEDIAIMKFTVYKTTNNINGKIYVGFHKINKNDLPTQKNDNGSIFSDGYMGSGKLIKLAIEKYGPENFTQELIGIYDTKEEAEKVESSIVNKDFTLNENTYNLSVGGNVRIMYGENNGFYGKNHTEDTKHKIKSTREVNGLPTYQYKIYDCSTNEQLKGYKHIFEKFSYNKNDMLGYTPYKTEGLLRRFFISKLCVEKLIRFEDTEKQKEMEDFYQIFLDEYNFDKFNKNKESQSKRIEVRVGGISKSEEQRKKMSKSRKNWINENKEKHNEIMNVINKNPEKIRKTAEKHRGMKRSAESRKRMSDSRKGCIPHNKGKKLYTDGVNKSLFLPGSEPSGWLPIVKSGKTK